MPKITAVVVPRSFNKYICLLEANVSDWFAQEVWTVKDNKARVPGVRGLR